MKHLIASIALFVFCSSVSGNAQTPAQQKSITRIAAKFAKAFTGKSLGRLDGELSYSGTVKFIIEHSISDEADNNGYAIRRFKKLRQSERWLKSREREDGTPFRATGVFTNCKKGVCTFDLDGGISHNHLYLQKIAYGFRNGQAYIKTIYLLDGD